MPEAMPQRRFFLGVALGVLFFMRMLYVVSRNFRSSNPQGISSLPAAPAGVHEIGKLLFTDYLLPFELTSFLILAALIGAITLARSKDL